MTPPMTQPDQGLGQTPVDLLQNQVPNTNLEMPAYSEPTPTLEVPTQPMPEPQPVMPEFAPAAPEGGAAETAQPSGDKYTDLTNFLNSNGITYKEYSNESGKCIIVEI